jgi:hypothetical protein
VNRIHRTLSVLALSATLTIGTTAVALATPPTHSAPAATVTRDHSGLAPQIAQRKALYQSELQQNLGNASPSAVEQARAGERAFAATAAQPVAEDQNDRLLRGIEAASASRTQAAVEQARAGERNLGPAPVVTIAPQPVPAATGRDVDPLAILLLGLVGGLAGGAAAGAGWFASHRRTHGAVAA